MCIVHIVIELLTGLPDGVVGFEAIGEVLSTDYTDILAPAIESAIAAHGDIGVLYVLGDRFTGYSGGALWEDGIVGTEHFRHWRRIAMVTDTAWVEHAVQAFGWMMPSRIKLFPVSSRQEAEAWVSAH